MSTIDKRRSSKSERGSDPRNKEELQMSGQWRHWLSVVAVLFLLAVPVISIAEDAADVSGPWALTFQGRQGPRTMDMTLQQEGSKLTGSLSGPQGNQMPLTGTVEGNAIEFKVTFQTQRGDFDITYKGEVQGDEMSGQAQMPQNSIEWSAKRK
jgi:hypothetical protein